MMLEHGIHDDQQLAHAGGQSHLGRFALAAQALIELPDHRVAVQNKCRINRVKHDIYE